MAVVVHRENISRVFWEPYIITGYRQTNTSFWQCCKYAFAMHNDVGNFWTHFIPAIAWMVWLYCLSFSLDFSDPYWYPLMVIWVGACCYSLCSAIAHFLGCKSLNTRQSAFMIDYLGISLYSVSGWVAYYFYERCVGLSVFNYKQSMIVVGVLINSAATFSCCCSRFYCEKYRYFARSGSYFLPYVYGLFPFATRFLSCVFTGEQCISETLHLHIIAFLISFAMLFFFVSKVPERFFPGSFDYFFHSHQLFHIMSVLMTTFQLYFLTIDAEIRRDVLTSDPYLFPDFNSTVYPFLAVLFIGILNVVIMSFLLFSGILVTNKVPKNKLN